LALAAASSAATALAADDIVVARGWPQVDRAQSDTCRAEVRGNGQIFRVAGSGFRPGESVHFHLENEDINPVEYLDKTDQSGAWRRFYIPFLWHREGGTVTVRLTSARCRLVLSFDWRRRTADAL
jgi:hypothetical protein